MAPAPPPADLPKMEYRFLGRSGLQVSAIALGGWLTYGGYAENEKTFDCMKAAYDVGINFFDCAENYSAGESEIQMGLAIKKFGWKRNDLVISSKVNWGEAYGDSPVNQNGLSRKRIIEGVNGCLKRLDLEYLDLIYAHRPDRNTPIEETVRAFNHIIDQGKAFYWGTSEWNSDEIATAWRYADKLGLIGPLMEQPQYNMFVRHKVEKEFEHLYPETGLGLTIFSPLKMGILTGKYNDGIPADSRFAADEKDPSGFVTNFAANSIGNEEWLDQVEKTRKLKPIAEKLGVTQAALALGWVIKNPNISSAITGASRPEQIYESLRALEIQDKLTKEVLDEIDVILGNKPEPMVRRFMGGS